MVFWSVPKLCKLEAWTLDGFESRSSTLSTLSMPANGEGERSEKVTRFGFERLRGDLEWFIMIAITIITIRMAITMSSNTMAITIPIAIVIVLGSQFRINFWVCRSKQWTPTTNTARSQWERTSTAHDHPHQIRNRNNWKRLATFECLHLKFLLANSKIW